MKDFGDCKAKALVLQDTQSQHPAADYCMHGYLMLWGKTWFCENYRSSENSMGNVKFYFLSSMKYFRVVR